MNLPTLALFPGLGVDARVFAPQRKLPLDLRIVEWIDPESSSESLKHYAGRLADRLQKWSPGFVGGVSFGAMVALEAARYLKVQGVISIGGCASFRDINPLFRAVLHLGASLPDAGVRAVISMTPIALHLLEDLHAANVQLMTRMLLDQPPSRIRWTCRAILNWEYQPLPDDPHLYGIHGEYDNIIPAKDLSSQFIVAGGKHLISLSHSSIVNRFIINSVTSPTAAIKPPSSLARIKP